MADKNFYLQLTVEKMHPFAIFTNKYLRPCGYSGDNFTAMVTYTNSKTKLQGEAQFSLIIN